MTSYLKCNNCNTENPAKVFELKQPEYKKYENINRLFILQFDICAKCFEQKKRIVGLLNTGVYKDFDWVRKKNYKTIESAIIAVLDELPKATRQDAIIDKFINDKCFKIIVGEATVKMAHNTGV